MKPITLNSDRPIDSEENPASKSIIQLDRQNKYYTGIQVNLERFQNLGHLLQPYLEQLNNNLGDCFLPDRCPLPNTLDKERAVVECFAEYQNLDRENCWGYVGGGSSLGNLQGMWIGKTLHPEATLVFPDNAHYSIYKYSQLLGFQKIKVIKTKEKEQLDLGDFKTQIHDRESVILLLTAGTTMTAAYDPIDECIEILKQKQCNFYLHVDAALGGMVIPFITRDLDYPAPNYTFKNPNINSTTISVHKILGSPMPANVFLSRKETICDFEKRVNEVSYLGNIKDITLYGSRDGFRALAVFARLSELNVEAIANLVKTCLERANYLVECLQKQGMKSVYRHPFGMAVVFPMVAFNTYFSVLSQQELYEKYNLVKSDRYVHFYAMGHVTRSLCDEFVEDCTKLQQ
ncbi:MAG: aminotransferase class V-fold PLP-dependent enzyme [Cyanobacteria bacterium SBLK]|nr:aminotransferase class V-fold PLP-dependent enzyme [Cyanobacteria bacterium SBLK]